MELLGGGVEISTVCGILSSVSEVQEVKIDKSAWGHGPWQTEPDRVQWQHAGYACLVVRNDRLGHWCGYVGVDRSHPHYGQSGEDLDVLVHGGLTYADKCRDNICHVPEPGMPADVWWLGFDCAHAGDMSPARAALEREWAKTDPSFRLTLKELRDVYRTLDYVKAETEDLAEQLRNLAG
jgi:hypothetical protein